MRVGWGQYSSCSICSLLLKRRFSLRLPGQTVSRPAQSSVKMPGISKARLNHSSRRATIPVFPEPTAAHLLPTCYKIQFCLQRRCRHGWGKGVCYWALREKAEEWRGRCLANVRYLWNPFVDMLSKTLRPTCSFWSTGWDAWMWDLDNKIKNNPASQGKGKDKEWKIKEWKWEKERGNWRT